MRVLAIDPGSERSALVAVEDDRRISLSVILDNDEVRRKLYELRAHYPIAIESIASYGMPVGREVFDTCYWIGRFIEASYPHLVALVYRKDVKMHLCGTTRAKDPNIRQALLDKFGKEATKGIKKDLWAALGVAVTHLERSMNWKGDRETDILIRGAKCAEMKEVLKEFKIENK